MPKPEKLPCPFQHTSSSQIRTALRRLWLRSRERSAALRREGYRCERCGRKQSRAKGKECSVEVHHVSGETRLKEIEDVIRKNLLCDPDMLECLCAECHKAHHANKEG